MARGNTWGTPGNRTEADAIKALKRHIRLLWQYRKCAFEEGDYDYLGEIACKLRLLTGTDGGRPLLLDLMAQRRFDDRFPAEVLFRLIPGERPQGEPTLRKYLTQYSAIEGHDGRKTNAELISEWANKMGAAHEDPTTPVWLHAAFHTATDFAMPDVPPAHVQWLKQITDLVLEVSGRFLKTLENIVIRDDPFARWDRPHAAGLKVRLFVAHYAELAIAELSADSGVLVPRIYASGIGFDAIAGGTGPRFIGIGATIDVSYDAFDIDHHLAIRLVDREGEQVNYQAGNCPVVFTHSFKVPRPAEANQRWRFTHKIAANVPLPSLRPGRYSMRALLGGTLTDEVFFMVFPGRAPDAAPDASDAASDAAPDTAPDTPT